MDLLSESVEIKRGETVDSIPVSPSIYTDQIVLLKWYICFVYIPVKNF